MKKNLVDEIPARQRNRFLKAITLVLLCVSASLLLVNADVIINPQVSNSSAYMKQFFVTSDGTLNGTVGSVLQGSGVFSKTYCNLGGTICRTLEDIVALEDQFAGLLPQDSGEYMLFASGGKLFTGGFKSTTDGYSIPTQFAIGYSSPTNALDVSGSVYVSRSLQVMGSLFSSILSGVSAINGVNIGDFVTINYLVDNAYITGGVLDSKISDLTNYITGNYYTTSDLDTRFNSIETLMSNWNAAYGWGDHATAGYLTGSSVNALAKANLPCTQNQLPQYSGGVWICGTISTVAETDPIWAAAKVDYYTTGEIEAKNYVTGGLLDSKIGDITNYITGNYYTTSDLDTRFNSIENLVPDWNIAYGWGNHATAGYLTQSAWSTNNATSISHWDAAYGWGDHATKGYITGGQVKANETDPYYTASSWYGTTNNAADWDTAYGWGDHATAGYLTQSDWSTNNATSIGHWDAAYNWGNHATQGYLTQGAWSMNNATSILHWDTAYGWGDHATAGYLTQSDWSANNATSIGHWDAAYNWGNHATKGYITGGQVKANETDPVYNASTWKTTTNNAGNWDIAYGWGNHAAQGYLTQTAWSTNNATSIGHWNAAYGWGNHAAAGYLTQSAWSTNNSTSISNWDTAYSFVSNANSSNTLVINGTNVGIGTGTAIEKFAVDGTGLFTKSIFAEAFLYNSDKRLKTNILEIIDPLQKISQLHGYTFDWKKDGKHDIGVIAQEVESVFPEAVVTKADGFKTVNYPSLVAPIIEAIKALYTKYLDQQNQIDELKAQIVQLQTIVNNVK